MLVVAKVSLGFDTSIEALVMAFHEMLTPICTKHESSFKSRPNNFSLEKHKHGENEQIEYWYSWKNTYAGCYTFNGLFYILSPIVADGTVKVVFKFMHTERYSLEIEVVKSMLALLDDLKHKGCEVELHYESGLQEEVIAVLGEPEMTQSWEEYITKDTILKMAYSFIECGQLILVGGSLVYNSNSVKEGYPDKVWDLFTDWLYDMEETQGLIGKWTELEAVRNKGLKHFLLG